MTRTAINQKKLPVPCYKKILNHIVFSNMLVQINPKQQKGTTIMNKISCNQKTTNRGFRVAHYLQMVIALVFVVTTGTATAQWNTQSPVPTHLDVRGVGAPTASRVFIATDDNSFDNGGALFESNDGGTTWVQRNIPLSLSSPFYGLFFLDSQNGWAYGNENYRTTDGGTTWTPIPFLGSTYFMEFYTTMLGIATGNFGQYISLDGGLTWSPSPNDIFDLDLTNSLTGLGISNTGIFRTTDGGTTFTQVFTGNAIAVEYISGTVATGIADGLFIRSTNGGVTWTSGASANGRQQLQAVSGNIVLAWGRSGNFPNYDDRVFRSTDGGQTWTDLGEVIPAGVYAFTVADPQSVTAADMEGNMFYSSNAGLTWSQSFSTRGQQSGYLSSAVPVFANATTGYFGYGAGFMMKTTNGGASWAQISSGTGESLNDIDRFANGNLIAVGDNGTLLKSNGTSPWIIDETFTTSHLKAVQIISSTEAFVVNNEGRVYKTVNAGSSWTASVAMPADMTSAEDVHFTTSSDGWVIGQSYQTAALYHTTNGGQSWTPVTDFLGAYVAVDVAGTNIWAANVGGNYYRSMDAGNTWIPGDLPASVLQIHDMDFFNANIGYAVGSWGNAFRSEDGGITWEVLQTPFTDHDFTDICLMGANELWLSTNDDVAYYSANGGQNWAVLDMSSEGFGNFSAITANPAGDAWAIGFQGYIEHFSGPPPPPLNLPPVASFNYIASGLTVDFTDTSTDADGTITSWSWDFGDGTSSTTQHPVHTYTTANTYLVYLTVTDDDGDTGTAMHAIAVQPGPGGTFGDFTEVTPIDSLFVTPQDEDFWVITTAPADYDNDGDIDIAVFGYYVIYNQSVEDRMILLRNDGPADSTAWAFTHIYVPIGDLTAGSSDMSWGDLDGDGDQDLVVGTNGQTVIFRNNAGTLALVDTDLPPYWEDNDQADFDLRSITWADFDNDGDMDLLLPSVYNDTTFNYYTALMRNDGPNGTTGWNFTSLDNIFAPTLHAQSSWADFDGDQDLDLLLVNLAPLMDEGFIRRYRNDGNGIFTGEDILGGLTVEHGEAQWGDYDGDGDLDILVAGNVKELDSTYTHMALRIYRNDSLNYTQLEVIPCIPCEGWFDLSATTWADYDSDGDMDILLAGTYNSGSNIEGRAKIYTNNNGVFTDSGNDLPAPRASGDRGGTFSWLDIDGEGDLDYFIAGQYFVPGGNGLVEAQMHIYRNDVPGQNTAPTSPTGLGVALQGEDTVLLSWTASTDDHTPVPALTYDLDLFRDNVPVAIPSRLPEPGNVSAMTEWLLTGLQDGNYEWTIRAVDAAYIGSNVATGQFTIGGPTGIGGVNDLPGTYSLAQNYPNPFKPATTIQYQIPENGHVSLTVYNFSGKEVSVLVNGYQAAGKYSLTFSDTKLPAGLYFYSLRSGNYSETRKMVIGNW